jgi:hypothetical protein
MSMRLKSFLAVLAFAVLSSATAEAATMTFKPVTIGDCRTSCERALMAEGDIALDSDAAFERAFEKAGNVRTVLLNSPGGNVVGGLELGYSFRRAKLNVSVAPGGECFSACAFAMLGGVSRRVPEDARFGVHGFVDRRAKVSARDMSYDKDIYGLLRLFAEEMGVSPSLIAMAEKTRNDDLRILSPEELKKTRVVTGR